MSQSPLRNRHVSDADLLRAIDGELSDVERVRLRRHLAGCEECAQREDAMRSHAEAARRYLHREELGSGPDEVTRARALAAVREASRARAARRARSPHRRMAAAAVAVVALGIATVAPVRAWMLERVAGVTRSAETVAAPVATMPSAVVERRGSMITFEPTGEVFEIRLEHGQVGGAIGLTVRPVSRATAQLSGDGSENILVLPAGLRIENHEGSSARYWVTLPSSLSAVRVVAGDRVLATLPVSALAVGRERVIPLAPRSR